MALAAQFAEQQGAKASAESAARWLVDERRISTYQAKVLLAGRPGPFVYGEYRIYDRIESGRMAGIFRAIHAETRYPVCLYFLSGAAAQDPDILERLAREAAAAHRASVGHPHLARCYHLDDEKSYKFIVLQDLQGKRLERRLATGGALAPAEACRIARQAALGLARLHAMGIVHGDVRPGNVWIEPDDTCKLLLFPLQRDPLADVPTGHLVVEREGRRLPAQADYIAPELIDGGAADARSDIYSLGCTLYHALANQAPFSGGDLKQKLERHRTETPLALDEINAAIPPALAKLVNYMMAKDPDMRYQQANSVVEALLPHLAPGEAETTPQEPSKRSQAYEAWLAKHLAATTTAPPSTPRPEARDGRAATPAASAIPAAAVATAEPIPAAAPVVAATIAAVPAAVATPVAAVAPPVAAVAAPVPGYPNAIATAAVGVPVAAVPVASQALGGPIPAVAIPAGPVAAPMMGGGHLPGAMPVMPSELDAVTMEGADSAKHRARRAARRGRRMAMIVAGVMALVIGGIAAAVYFGPGKDMIEKELLAPVAPVDTTPEPAAAVVAETPPEKPAEPLEPIWSPDGSMWASPTHGKPVDVAFLAPGCEAVIVLRPADLVKKPQGEALLDPKVLGPLADWVHNQLPALSGTTLDNITQAIIGVLQSGGSPRLALVLHVKQPVAAEDLLKAWGGPGSKTHEGKTYYEKQDLAYYVPDRGKGSTIVIAPPTEMRDVIASDGQAVLLPLDVEALIHESDADRLLTAVIGPGLMNTPGKGLFSGAAARLKEPLDWFLTGADAMSPMAMAEPTAILFSCHLAKDFFAELRIENDAAGPQAPEAAKELRDRLKQVPKKVDLGVHELQWTPYSKNLLVEFPDMVRTLQQFTRVGTADKQIVLRTYLPAAAASSLALGTHLCLLENPIGTAAVATGTAPAAAPAQPSNPEQVLDKKISISFPRNTLEKCMEMMQDELGIPIEIKGSDLQLEGITKNQSFGLDEQNKPAREIFKKVLLQANPDGKLVYVFKPNASGNGQMIWLTTRAAAAKRGDKLPPELEKAPPKKK